MQIRRIQNKDKRNKALYHLDFLILLLYALFFWEIFQSPMGFLFFISAAQIVFLFSFLCVYHFDVSAKLHKTKKQRQKGGQKKKRDAGWEHESKTVTENKFKERREKKGKTEWVRKTEKERNTEGRKVKWKRNWMNK